MKYDVFKGTEGKVVVVAEEAKLPPAYSPYNRMKSITIARGDGPRIGASSDEIIDAVEKDGYFMWPQEE